MEGEPPDWRGEAEKPKKQQEEWRAEETTALPGWRAEETTERQPKREEAAGNLQEEAGGYW